ncbi:hypothetical protein RICGR_0301 [Rickettsiella grylli]|uniref:Uncharacterized protein n=1 Tax=Rickettsiella grylli TaxID=59196 RepID=A8PK51_9COXI|nr:hypothetical protein RICGR_0301 [Rickettsiella grylli]
MNTPLSDCISRCNANASIIFIEHGYLQNSHFPAEKKLYELLNALFDIIANIGLRPTYFTETAPAFGAHFFIHYLEPNDFISICKNSSQRVISQTIYAPLFLTKLCVVFVPLNSSLDNVVLAPRPFYF